MGTLADVRAELAAAIAAAVDGAHVYPHPEAAPIPPAVVVLPNHPYVVPTTIGRDPVRTRVRFLATVLVAQHDNAGSLDKLEQLAAAVLAALPAGYAAGEISHPGITTVGTTDMLVADVPVEVAVELHAPETIPPDPAPEE